MKVDVAVVLSGGPGTRLRPLTNDAPKGMIEVGGKPLLQWIIEWLRDNGIRQVVLGVAYLKEKIIEYFGDGNKFGVDIQYSVHSVEGGTGEGFRLAISRYIDQKVFFAMNGDQITELNLSDLADFHIKHNPVATVAVSNHRCPYGHVQINGENNVTDFIEKPLCPLALCNTGIYVLTHEILDYLPEKGDAERITFPALIKSRNLKAYSFNGFFVTINTQKDLFEVERELKRRHR